MCLVFLAPVVPEIRKFLVFLALALHLGGFRCSGEAFCALWTLLVAVLSLSRQGQGELVSDSSRKATVDDDVLRASGKDCCASEFDEQGNAVLQDSPHFAGFQLFGLSVTKVIHGDFLLQ